MWVSTSVCVVRARGVPASTARRVRVGWRKPTSVASVVGARPTRFAGPRVRVRAFGTRESAWRTHRQHVVVVVAELLLGEKAQVLRARVEPQRRLHGCSSLRRTGFFRDAASPTVPDARGGRRRASTEGVGQCGSGGGAVACRARAFESDGVTRASRRTRFREPVKITALGLVESRTVVIPAESAPKRVTLEISAPAD